jgi:hypothetical protein
MSRAPLGQPVDEVDRARIRRLVDQCGEREAASRLGICDRTLLRCLAGLGCYPGTRALVRLGLDRIEREAA